VTELPAKLNSSVHSRFSGSINRCTCCSPSPRAHSPAASTLGAGQRPSKGFTPSVHPNHVQSRSWKNPPSPSQPGSAGLIHSMCLGVFREFKRGSAERVGRASEAFLSSQGSDLQSGVTHATGGYAGSFCTGVGKLPCCACAALPLRSSASAVQHQSARRSLIAAAATARHWCAPGRICWRLAPWGCGFRFLCRFGPPFGTCYFAPNICSSLPLVAVRASFRPAERGRSATAAVSRRSWRGGVRFLPRGNQAAG
jgi:hypothetical protein